MRGSRRDAHLGRDPFTSPAPLACATESKAIVQEAGMHLQKLQVVGAHTPARPVRRGIENVGVLDSLTHCTSASLEQLAALCEKYSQI